MNVRKIFLLLFLAAGTSTQAQWHSLGNLDSYQVQGNEVILASGPGVVRITLLAQDLIRVRLAPAGEFGPDYSWAVIKTDWPIVKPDVNDGTENLRIGTSELALVVKKRPLRISFFDRQGHLLNRDDESLGMCWNGAAVRAWKEMPLTENYYGFGEKAGSLDRKYHAMTMWNSDIPAYKADTDPLYQTIPFYGPSPKKILSRFTELVGRMPLPPRWSLGYQQCRWSYYPESRVRKLAGTFRQKKIPCDVIYLDIDYMEGYRIFTWSKKNFPDPKKMISDLAEDGFKIAVIVDPGIKVDSSYDAFRTGLAGGDFLRYPDGRLFIGRVWPGECVFPDFSRPETRQWWGSNFSALTSVGVRGFWNDMNEPSVFDTPTKTIDLSVVHDDHGLMAPHAKDHNVYGLQMTEGTYEGVRTLVPKERPFVLTRASYAGGQRYSAAWSGDNISSWEHLQMAVPMLLNLSISGQPFVGTDIGGFVGSPDGELYARWLQLGVFSPLMRTHTEWGSEDQEPWSYGPKFEPINKATIELRYKLLPYVYNVMVQASSTGIPAMRPLAFEYPDDGSFVRNETEFMFGDDLLIAPILWPGETKRNVRLPRGEWYDYWTGKGYHGDASVTVDAPIDRIPIFVRSGAILPTQQLLQYSDQAPIDPLTLTIYPADSSSSTYYEDDGHTFRYQDGSYLKRGVEQRRTAGSVEVTLGKVDGSYRPPDRSLVLEFLDMPTMPQKVRIAGRELRRTQSASLRNIREGWSYDPASKMVRVKVGETSKECAVSVLR